MRVTVLASSYPRFPGDGTAPFVQSLAEHLVELGHDVEVIAPYDVAVSGTLDARVPVHRFRYALVDRWHILGHARSLAGDTRLKPGTLLLLPYFLLAQFQSALQVARRQQAQIIHAHWVLPNGLVGAWVARMLGIPLVVSLHGSDIFVARGTPAFGRVAGWVFRQAALVTACSEDLRQGALELGATPQKVHLVPWGADPERFSPAVQPLDRSCFGLSQDAAILIALGRIVAKKGFDILVQALPTLLESDPRVHVLIGGDGDQREVLAKLAASLGVQDHVHLPGRIPWDDVPAFLAMGDVFVLPSVRDAAGNVDGLPTVLLEALALGKPVVASQIGGVPLVISDGVNGVLCPAGDVDALTQTIIRLANDVELRIRLGQAARTSVEEEFNWLRVARRCVLLFETTVQH
jgi:glycosyltransferase involved in cell wall biosynthesis